MNNQLSVIDDHMIDIKTVLPQHISFEQFSKAANMAAIQNPDLYDCNEKSLFNAVMQCANDGLIPDSKEAALVPFKGNVSYIPMVSGVLKRIRQSGQVKSIIAKPVYDNDNFSYWFDEDGEHIKFEPTFGEKGELKLVFAAARLNSDELIVEVLPKNEIDKIRQESKASYSGNPWQKWYDRMAVKTAIHRIAKHLPNASEIADMALMGIEVNQPIKQINEAPKVEALHDYSAEQFNENLPKWTELMQAGKKTPSEMISFLSTKYTLSDLQIKQINEA